MWSAGDVYDHICSLYVHATLSSHCHRQWNEEEKARQQHKDDLAEEDEQAQGSDDAVSTVGGVLHEEHFIETKAGAGQNDVEAPHGSNQQDKGLLAVLKIVDWWKVCSIYTLLGACSVGIFSQLVMHAGPHAPQGLC